MPTATTRRRVCLLAATALFVPCLARPTFATSYPGEIRGYVSQTYQPSDTARWDWNRCVPDPIGQVQRLRQRGEVVGFRMGAGHPEPSCNVFGCKNHWQGIQRLPMAGRRYFVVSSRHNDASRFAVVHMGTRGQTGQRIRGNRMSTTTRDWNVQPSSTDAIVHTQLVNTSYIHPGGMQTLGRYLFVPLEEGGGTSRVYNYDMGSITYPWSCNPATGAGCPRKLWGFVFTTTKAAVAAVAKVAHPTGQDRYLLVTAQADSNVLEFYLSTPGLHVSHPDAFGAWGGYEAIFNRKTYEAFRSYYQNLNLITACPGPGYEAGQLYLLGTTQGKGSGTDVVDLFELSLAPISSTSYTAHIALVASKVLYCTAVSSTRQCDLDAAGGAYVDPDGRLLVYAAEYDNEGPPLPTSIAPFATPSVKMMEFRPVDHLDNPGTSAKEGCTSLADAFVELYDGYLGATAGPTAALPTTQNGLLIDYRDRTRRNHGSFGTAYDMTDKILSIRYCIPPGYKFRLFSDANYSSASAYIATFRGDASIAGVGNPSNGTIQGYRWPSNRGWSSGCFMTATGSACL
jgi:hypothetical protein